MTLPNFAISPLLKGICPILTQEIPLRWLESVLSNGTLKRKQTSLRLQCPGYKTFNMTLHNFKLRLLTFLLKAVGFSATSAGETNDKQLHIKLQKSAQHTGYRRKTQSCTEKKFSVPHASIAFENSLLHAVQCESLHHSHILSKFTLREQEQHSKWSKMPVN